MKRLNTLLVNNNYVSRIGLLGDSLRGIKILVLTNNRISSLADIDNIATLRTLEHLSLLENPVSQRLNYRLYVIFRIPSLKTLDFAKVSRKEREEAAKFFESKSGQEMIDAIAHESRSSKAIVGGDSKPSAALTEDQKRQVRAAIGAAKTREDVDRIEKQLKVPVLFISLSMMHTHIGRFFAFLQTGTFLFTDPVESTRDATEKADSSSGGAAEESVMSVA